MQQDKGNSKDGTEMAADLPRDPNIEGTLQFDAAAGVTSEFASVVTEMSPQLSPLEDNLSSGAKAKQPSKKGSKTSSKPKSKKAPRHLPFQKLSLGLHNINPAEIALHRLANRPANYLCDMEELKGSILLKGVNTVPIMVKKVVEPFEGKIKYLLIAGHRRWAAHLELGLEVRCEVFKAELSDLQVFEMMHFENTNRVEVKPYFRGVVYEKLLTEGLYKSAQQICNSLGVAASDMSNMRALAAASQLVLSAFESPADLVHNYGSSLKYLSLMEEGAITPLVEAVIRFRETSPAPVAAREIYDMVTGAKAVPPAGRQDVEIAQKIKDALRLCKKKQGSATQGAVAIVSPSLVYHCSANAAEVSSADLKSEPIGNFPCDNESVTGGIIGATEPVETQFIRHTAASHEMDALEKIRSVRRSNDSEGDAWPSSSSESSHPPAGVRARDGETSENPSAKLMQAALKEGQSDSVHEQAKSERDLSLTSTSSLGRNPEPETSALAECLPSSNEEKDVLHLCSLLRGHFGSIRFRTDLAAIKLVGNFKSKNDVDRFAVEFAEWIDEHWSSEFPAVSPHY